MPRLCAGNLSDSRFPGSTTHTPRYQLPKLILESNQSSGGVALIRSVMLVSHHRIDETPAL